MEETNSVNCKMDGKHSEIDTNLYSRQIGAFGIETMGRLIKMKVLISGLRGLGVETAKNMILAGPCMATLHDDSLVERRDLGSNFYLTESDVLKRTRADACAQKLADLNNYVAVKVHKGPITSAVLRQHNIVFFSETPRHQLVEFNRFCRSSQPPIGFVSAELFGLTGCVFVDYGDSFVVYDRNGEEPKSVIVAGVTQENPGVVHAHNDKPLPFSTGDWVAFREVQGMVELNSTAPRQITVLGSHSFTIEDTTGYSAFTREGIAQQVKVPVSLQFSSFEHCTKYPNSSVPGSSLITPDLGKFGRSEQLHIAIHSLLRYWDMKGSRPQPTDTAAILECQQIAHEMNEEGKTATEAGAVYVDTIDTRVLEHVVKFSTCQVSAMASYLGGICAQEIVKFTGKFTPLRQWLYVDSLETIPKYAISDHQITDSRYDDQTAIWGKAFQERLGELHLFLVGAGALGCEMMKSIALMGFCCGKAGRLTVTDMDNIEISNLNRQFLFKREHVGEAKSRTAGESARVMNPSLKVSALETRVGLDTESTFNDDFWGKQDIIVNALDNVSSRLYVDSRCVWYLKPLLESGTLGTKANVQVILPRITQSYGDSQDPPEESIPLCTLKHFPNAIEHTIEWARDAFQGLFCDGPQETVMFLQDPLEFLKKVRTEGTVANQRERLEKIKSLLFAGTSSASLQGCVEKAVYLFQEFFHNQIAQLIYTFPFDHVTSEGQPFWSGPKRPPTPLNFCADDPVHLQFVVAGSNLLAFNLGIPQERNFSKIRELAHNVKPVKFSPKQAVFKIDEKDTNVDSSGDDGYMMDCLIKELIGFRGQTLHITPVEFEKDDDTNLHIDFIWSCANLRARNYRIAEADRHKCVMIAGKIIPAVATTTAMVTGLVMLELVKTVCYKERTIEEFRNAFVNLALPLWVLSEPLPPIKATNKDYDPVAGGPVRARPHGFTPWDKVEFEIIDCTVEQLLNRISQEFNVHVAILSVGNACLYNSFLHKHKARMTQPLAQLTETLTKTPLPLGRKYVVVEASCSDSDGVDVLIPTIKLTFTT